MNVDFIPIRAAIEDFISDSGVSQGEVSERWLLKHAVDCIEWFGSTEQLTMKMGVCPVKNHTVQLPKDFKLLLLAASNPDYDGECEQCPSGGKRKYNTTRKEEIVQWVQQTYERDCELEINLVCNRCHKTECSCNTPMVEVDVDRIWQQANPQAYHKGFDRIGKFGDGPQYGYNSAGMPAFESKFQKMRVASSNTWNSQYFIGDCPNVGCMDCVHSFRLEKPVMKVDFLSGEVFLSYLGVVTDEEGYPLIPNNPDAFEAIFLHLTHKLLYREYLTSIRNPQINSQELRIAAMEAKQQREIAIGIARSALEIPDFQNFKEFIDTYWVRRIPVHPSDKNRRSRVPDAYHSYDKYLNSNTYRPYYYR